MVSVKFDPTEYPLYPIMSNPPVNEEVQAELSNPPFKEVVKAEMSLPAN
jgi:hypothetical protein